MHRGAKVKREAAVLILEKCERREEILLTQRASHLTAHAGEVAFPGGMTEPEDAGLLQTALRESHEEVGLDSSAVRVTGDLPASYTRQATKVTPFVGQLTKPVKLKACPNELESLFWFPTSLLLEDRRKLTDIFYLDGREYWAPVYEFEGYRVWGFTARVLVEYVKRFHGKEIKRDHQAPVMRHKPQQNLS